MAAFGTFLQWILIIFNGICVVLGVLVVVESIFELEKFNYGSPDYTEKCLQIIMGSILVVTAFVGCGGSSQKSLKLLILFIILLLILIVLHAWRLWHYDENRVRNATKLMITYTWIEELVEMGKMDNWHEKYKCCGQYGATDYTSLNISIPESCYQHSLDANDGLLHPYNDGCLTSVTTAYLNIYRLEKWFHISLICVEAFGILLSILLISNMTKETLRYTY